jgi:hypothetical protein
MMFGLLKPKLPLQPGKREWVDAAFVRLAKLLGAEHVHTAKVYLPTQQDFPDPYDGTESAVRPMLTRIATAMGVDGDEIDIEVFDEGDRQTSRLIPFYRGQSSGAAGLYFHDETTRARIAVNSSQLQDPMSLVAVIAHEVGHIILLRPGLVNREEEDMEPLNDLLTIFLGFGVFTANAAFRFSQFTSNYSQGWSSRRIGYLSEQLLGYALARFAWEREEAKPTWASSLSSNIQPYFKRSLAWFHHEKPPHILR